MKEAAGEANMTVITIVLIGVVAAVGVVFIPRILSNMNARSCCIEHGGTVSGSKCMGWTKNDGTIGNPDLSSLKGHEKCS